MKEKRSFLTLTGAIVILSICILLSASIIASAIRESSSNQNHSNYNYELSRFNENFEKLIEVLKDRNKEVQE